MLFFVVFPSFSFVVWIPDPQRSYRTPIHYIQGNSSSGAPFPVPHSASVVMTTGVEVRVFLLAQVDTRLFCRDTGKEVKVQVLWSSALRGVIVVRQCPHSDTNTLWSFVIDVHSTYFVLNAVGAFMWKCKIQICKYWLMRPSIVCVLTKTLTCHILEGSGAVILRHFPEQLIWQTEAERGRSDSFKLLHSYFVAR